MYHEGNAKSALRVRRAANDRPVSVVEAAERHGTGLGGRHDSFKMLFLYPALTVLWEQMENNAQHGKTTCEYERPRCEDQGKKLSL
mmetsp:Transcript_22964/g.60449  ORF Transcript_22964/g.60449 Transcript_22964/m.60449 type:complete len:86 (+) Transcript_22964:113-370(+)